MNKTNVFGAVQNSASSSSRISNFTKRFAVLTALLLTVVFGVRAQSVIMSGDYFLTHNIEGTSVNAAGTTTFNPTTCLWYVNNRNIRTADSDGNAFSGNNYLQRNSLTLGSSSQWSQAQNGSTVYYSQWSMMGGRTNYYLRLEGTNWHVNNTNSNVGSLIKVDISTVSSTSTNPTINGNDVLTATGNYTYTSSGAAYQAGGYVNYRFNNTDHFFDNNNTAITPKAATLNTAWSISANEYATISGSGVVTVNSIPTSDITLTIIATVSVTGGTPAAPAGTTLVGTKEITIQGSVPAAPTISVSGTTVTLQTDATGTTSIRYTIDGTDLTATTGTVYNGAFDISGSTNSPVTIKAITVRNGNASSVTTQQVKLTLPEPVIKVNAETGTATITCSNNSATIYYTTDGSTPSATNGTPYNGQITGLATMATVKAIAICDGWNSSSVASATVTIPSGVSGGTVTLFDYEDHNWSYYSDAECPIHSLNPADVKITYYGNGTKTVTNASAAEAVENPTSFSLDATTVKVGPNDDANVFVYYKTLERENVNGTGDLVYTTIPNPFLVRPTGNSGSAPTTVSITIEGYGSRDGATGSVLCTYFNASGDQESESININGTTTRTAEITAKIGTEITFTLTRTSNNRTVYFSAYYTEGKGEIASGSRNQTGSQNFGPFTISASSDANNYRGFYAWRVKSKSEGLNITDVNGNSFANNIIPAEAEIRFVTSNEYGNEVEFEALWAQAYVTDGTSDLSTRSNSYERNFHVVKSATSASSFQKSYPLTVTSYYPDGTSAGGSVTGGFTAAADTKFENITISNATNSTWTANGHDLIVGCGCSGTVNSVRGMSGGSSNAVNYTIRLESGTFGTFNMIDDETHTHSGTVSAKTIFGCDYDRANKDNDKLSISANSTVYGASSYQSFSGSANRNNLTYDWLIKSGKVQSSKNVGDANADACIYMGNSGSGNDSDGNKYQGKRRLTMEGGEVCNIAGGLNNYGSNRNNYIVNDGGWTLQIRMKGGTVRGSIYGAAAYAGASGDRLFIFTGGNIGGWVAGGANGTESDGGVLYGASYLYVGGNTQIDSKASEDVINRAVGGNVFGAGCGYNSGSESGQVTQGTNVIVADGAYVERGVYGGGSYGYTTATSNIYILGGTVGGKSGGASGTNYLAAIDGGVYGGACQNQGGTVNIIMNGGTVNGSVYGGSNYTGTLSGTSIVTLNGGTINGSLYGGGNGEGSANTNVTGAVQVRVYGGTVTDAVYGCNNNAGSPQSSVTVDIYGTDPAPAEGEYALHAVYGGGNKAPYSGIPIVSVHECDNSIEYVYGGGNAAAVEATNVTIYGGNVIGNVFGGGNGESGTAANVNDDTNVNIYGGTILNVYGGSNSKGTIGGTINVNVNAQAEDSDETPCKMHIGSVYGGGNLAASNVGNLTITCTGTDGRIDNVYGGANQANITGNIDLEINGGNIGNVFGGNNIKGDISGNITVTVGNDPNDCGVFQIDNVYGAGNLAPYGSESVAKGNYPVVNIYSGTVAKNVFGGGLGESAIVYGNPQVTIGDAVAEHIATVVGDVYGGGDAANVVGIPVVKIINDRNTTIGNVYGGGNAADVNGTDVNINGGTITGMVFGGGHGDKNADPQTEANVNGNVNVDITGGTINKVFGGSNSKGNITGTIALNIEKGDESCELHITEVYGGGNEAAGNAGTINIACTGGEGEGIGDVYGGANAADINTGITLNITGGNIKRVFGGNNTSGAIDGDIQVNVEWSGTCGVNALGNVYGAGNQAAYSGNTEVNILNGTVTGSVYGGGLGATAVVTGTTKVNIDGSADGHSVMVTQNVLGGGDAAAVEGSTDVNIINGAVSGSVFGGGNAAGVSENGVVDITGGTIASGVYGGSNASGAVGNTTVTLTNGIIGTNAAHANVHGGGYGKDTQVSGNVAVNIQGGTVYGDVYGGSALGTVNTDTDNTTVVNLTGGIIHGDAYGGGLGDIDTKADVNGNVTVTLDGTAFVLATTTDDKGNSIPTSGRVFGCNNINGSPKGTVLVKVLSTVAKNGDGTSKDKPEKDSGIYELQAVYGGGNLAAYNPTDPFADGQFTSYKLGEKTVSYENTAKPVQVVIDGCDLTSIEYVYGGGNAAATPATDVLVLGSYEIGNVFGGGNGKDRYTLDGGTKWNENLGADVGIIDAAAYAADHKQGLYGTGKSKASVLGGTVHNLFGASNTKGNVVSESLAYVDNANICDLNVGGIYGGGNEAYMDGDSKIELGCIEAMEEIYGGARNADVKGDINLTISSGHFDRVFGGNNIGGTINGSITVTIEETGCNPITIGELYGCGNQAPYTTPEGKHDPIINLISFTSIGNVFGGGFGEKAVVKGNPTVNIDVEEGDNSESDWAYNGQTITFSDGSKVTLPVHEKGEIGAIGTVYGGGNAAKVIGNTTVNMKNGIVENTLFGGGNAADVEGSTFVTIEIEDATINGNVFGGGNAADVEGSTSVTILDGTIGGNVYGGGNQGNVTGATKVQIGKQPTL